mgnify:FL=1
MWMPSKSVLSGHISMLSFSILVSVSFVAGSRIANYVEPNAVTFSRFLIALIFISIVLTIQKKWLHSKSLSFWKSAILGSLIAIYFITMFEGLKTASSTSMAVVFTLTPVLAGFFDLFFSGRRMSGKVWTIVLVAAIGALWIIFDGDLGNVRNFNIGYGEKLFFIGCVCHAIYAALIPRFNQGEPAIVQTFGTLSAGVIIVGFFSFNEIRAVPWSDLPFFVFLVIFYLAIFATATSFFLIQYSAVRLSSIKVMAYTYAIPIWVVITEVVFLDISSDHVVLIGAAIISTCLSLLLLNRES